MNKIAILYICTGKYEVFWQDFFESSEKYFLPESEKQYFVFTDSKHLYKENEYSRIHKFFQQSLGWPDNTLMRFHIFLAQEEALQRYDYLFFFNANCLFVDVVKEDEFLPKKDLLVVQHPFLYKESPIGFTYDRNKKSTAYIKKGDGKYYVFGAVNGGKTKPFLMLMHALKTNIDIDKANKVIALWHDESHLNKYILNRDDYTLLNPSYAYPEDVEISFKPKILIREKSKYIDVISIKNRGISRINKLFLIRLRQLKHKLKQIIKEIIKYK